MKRSYITSKMSRMKTKKSLVILLFIVLLINLPVFCLGDDAGIHIIGDDAEKDLRKFDGTWLTENLDDTDWDEVDEGLDEVYNKLYNNWDDKDACDPLYDNTQEPYYNPDNLEKYTKNNFVDIIQLRVENLDQATAKMIVEVNGDADSADKMWFLFVWTDCIGDDSDNLIFFGIFIPEGLTGVEYSEYDWQQGNSEGNGTMDFENSGHNIEMDFDTDNWDNVKNCNVRAIMLTTKDEDIELLEEEDMIVDIFPDPNSENQLSWLWILLIIIIIIIVAVLVYLYIRSRNRKEHLNFNKPRVKGNIED